MGVLEDWPRPRGQNFVALALKTPGLGLDHAVLEHIPVFLLISRNLPLTGTGLNQNGLSMEQLSSMLQSKERQLAVTTQIAIINPVIQQV